ncbi:hypothetical protein BJV82DRAFT_296954 [Fennellomyces sp. T-0311]|nr:hypothetical protein BJV82DRAFT_337047 [Fennellomyces sp. T-0311]KAI8138410.1 hypothetical protein BJV82DRAFT_296954 [Fennellomyces sp. T-0311]
MSLIQDHCQEIVKPEEELNTDTFWMDHGKCSVCNRWETIDWDSRFAREGSVSTGALLQNRSIGECLYLLMYNTNGGAARLSPPPEEITREFIALAYVMMFYRMVLMYGFQSVRPEWQNQFSEGSHWHKTYDRIIQGYGMGEDDLVDWEAVIEFQSSIIQGMHSRDGSQHATSNPEAFFQALYPDGVDFDDN